MAGTRIITSTLEFPYSRTLGPTIGQFAEGLRAKRLLASRTRSGKVQLPPLEFDPSDGSAVRPELVEVGPLGTVRSWTWVAEPTSRHPLEHPFAFALIAVDGADTELVHVLTATSAEEVEVGTRVRPRWRSERRGRIDDIEGWERADDN